MLVTAAAFVTLLALIHHADHVVRGELVSDHGLDGDWNHSGWPFRGSVTPFTFSLAVYAILVPGIVLTVKGRAWAGYWLVASLVLAAVIVVVHFLPGPHTETPRVIYESYEQSSGHAVALAILFALALWARLSSGRWSVPNAPAEG